LALSVAYGKLNNTLCYLIYVGPNTSATLGLLRPLNGYLVYDIHVKNNADNTTHAVIVDPGNGKILYNQPLASLFGGDGISHFGMFGQGKMGPWSGGYGAGARWFDEHNGMMTGPSSHVGPTGSIPPRTW
jgi:hypothetical protein